MSSPVPPVELQDPCSVIVNNVLYVYTPDAFQSLELKYGGKWAKLQNGVPVTGAACVLGTDNGLGSGAALWVIGGTTNSSASDYPGLQKYSFASQSWATIMPLVTVTAGRLDHAATFLNETASILVYAGGQNGTTAPSSATFVIDTKPPYNVQSYTTHINPPVTAPILLPWTNGTAITMGGDPNNRNISKFDPDNGWSLLPTKLTFSFKTSSYVQAAIVDGQGDDSKVLQIYDFSTAPNQVAEILLQTANGQPAQAGQTVGAPSTKSPSKKRKRTLTVKNWPVYNATNAPTSTREGCSLALDGNGLAVMSGGNGQNPIVIFDQEQNSWVNTTQFFGAANIKQQSILVNGLHTATASSSTATSTSTNSAIAAPGGMSENTKIILGIVLGSVLGSLLVIAIILLLCRWHQSRRKRRYNRRQFEEDEKQRMSFADRGDPLMKEAGGSIPYQYDGARSRSSLAMVSAKTMGHRATPSDSSTTHLVKKNGVWMNEPVEMDIIKERSNSSVKIEPWDDLTPPATITSKAGSSDPSLVPKRNSGWSRYWSGSAAAGAAAVIAVNSTPPRKRKSAFSTKKRSSQQSTTSSHNCRNHGPTEIPPLQLGQQFDGERISRVATGSPRLSQGSFDLQRGQAATLERPNTANSVLSNKPASTINDSIFTHDVVEEATTWTPVSRSDWTTPGYRDTSTSSIYTDINHSSMGPLERDQLQQIQSQSSRIPQARGITAAEINRPAPPTTRASNLTIWPRSSIMPVNSDLQPRPVQPNASAFSGAAPMKQQQQQQQPPPRPPNPSATSDLNWLNLGSTSK